MLSLFREIYASRRRSRRNIRLAEIIALEEQRPVAGAGERIGEAIAIIERGRMSATAIGEVGAPRDLGLLDADRFDRYP